MARLGSVEINPLADGVVESFEVAAVDADRANAGRRIVTIDARVRRPDGVLEARRFYAAIEPVDDGRPRLVRLTTRP